MIVNYGNMAFLHSLIAYHNLTPTRIDEELSKKEMKRTAPHIELVDFCQSYNKTLKI